MCFDTQKSARNSSGCLLDRLALLLHEKRLLRMFLNGRLCFARGATRRAVPAVKVLRHVQLVGPTLTNIAATLDTLRDMAIWPHAGNAAG
jgi:hypothetical protein